MNHRRIDASDETLEIWLDTLIAHEARYSQMAAVLQKRPSAWILQSSGMPDYRDANRILRLRDDGRGPEAVTAEAIQYFLARDLPVTVDLDAVSERQGLGAALRRRGVMPVMGRRALMRLQGAGKLTPRDSSQTQVIPIANETGNGEAALWIEMVCSDSEDDQTGLWRRVAECEASCRECRLLLALWNGRPAGACDLFFADNWARIDSVVTHPSFRRRGVASTLVTAAVRASLALGAEVTYLFTEAAGPAFQLYTGLGFSLWDTETFRRHIL